MTSCFVCVGGRLLWIVPGGLPRLHLVVDYFLFVVMMVADDAEDYGREELLHPSSLILMLLS